MKSIEEIKNQVAVRHGFKKWSHIPMVKKGLYIDEVAYEYAKQCCQTQIVKCTINLNVDYLKRTEKYSDAVNSILNTPNVADINPN